MKLKCYIIPIKHLILSSKFSTYFIIDIFLGSNNYKAFAFLDIGILACFLNEEV